MQFSKDLRPRVLAGDVTVSVRLWRHAMVTLGRRYPVGPGWIEVDAVDVVAFAEIDDEDVRLSGEPDREAVRRRAAHAGPVHDDTIVHRVTFHVVDDDGPQGASVSA